MPSPGHEAYRKRVLEWSRSHAHESDVPAALEQYKDAALVLWNLDLEPARPILRSGYAAAPRGAEPWDPLLVLRALLLMLLVGQCSINSWVPQLRGSRVLRMLCDLPEDEQTPGVGTFYDFLHRLHDGPQRHDCEAQQRPSRAERRRARSARPKRTRAEKLEHKRQRQKSPVTADAAELGVSEKLLEQLRAASQLPNPADLLGRLAQMLLEVGVVESARRGLLGDLGHLVVSGDGSTLYTGANGAGKRTCDHSRQERCDCPRIYSDPDAAWGYDSYNECYFFGHHFYELLAPAGEGAAKHDLPLFLRLDPGNETDFTASLRAFEHLRKLWHERQLSWSIAASPLDCGHDCETHHRYLLEKQISPIIPLKSDAPAVHPQRAEVRLSPRGIPLCEADAEMSSWGSAGADRRVFICGVKAGTLERCPLAPPTDPEWLCRPALRWGPTISLSVSQNPRLCPPVPRNTERYGQLYSLRSGSERSNSVKKQAFKLQAAGHRRSSFWLIRLYLIAVLQHARAWVAEANPDALLEHLLGPDALAKAS